MGIVNIMRDDRWTLLVWEGLFEKQEGNIVLHRNIRTNPEILLKTIVLYDFTIVEKN